MSKKIMITTLDNPYDPFIQFDEWLMYDMFKGYFTCERLASISIVSDQLSDEENFDTIEYAFQQLSRNGIMDKDGNIIEYKKIIKET